MRLLYQFPTCLQRLFGGVVWRGKEIDSNGHKTVYLTFDDGPIPEVTPRLLELLDELDVKATFFMVGDNIHKHPDIYRSVLAHGHAVGNHTYHHVRGWHLSTEEYLAEVSAWEQEATGVSGVSGVFCVPESPLALSEQGERFGDEGQPRLGCPSVRPAGAEPAERIELGMPRSGGKGAPFRPPHGQLTKQQLKQINDRNYAVYMWDVLTHDYNEHYSAECMVSIVQRYTRPGSIINWHDSLRSNERMLTAVRQSVIWLKSQGYSFSLL